MEDGFRTLLQECGFDSRTAKRAVATLRPALRDPSRHRLYPDAIPVLAELQRRGYRCFLLSNNFPELWEVAQELGLAPYFSGHIVSGEVGWDKPGREIFETAQKLAGQPQRAIMIGDSVGDDIEGAKGAGLGAILVHSPPDARADACCSELTGLLELLP